MRLRLCLGKEIEKARAIKVGLKREEDSDDHRENQAPKSMDGHAGEFKGPIGYIS